MQSEFHAKIMDELFAKQHAAHNAEVDKAVEAVREALKEEVTTGRSFAITANQEDYFRLQIAEANSVTALTRLSELAKQGPGG